MRIKIVFLFSLFILMIFFIDDSVQNRKQRNEWLNTLTKFSRELWRTYINEFPKTNLFFSPLFVHLYLTLFTFASSDETREELLRLLKYNHTIQSTMFYYDELKKIPDWDGETTILTDTKMLIYKNFNLKNEFLRLTNHIFNWYFEKITAPNAKQINQDVRNATGGAFSYIINDDDLGEESFASSLTHTFVVRRELRHQFVDDVLNDGTFYQNGVEPSGATYKFVRGLFRYGIFPRLGATILVMPYNYNGFKIMIILPNKRDGIFKVEKEYLSKDYAQYFQTRLRTVDVSVAMPDFTIFQHVKLNPILMKMGLVGAFTENSNFSNLFMESELNSKKVGFNFHDIRQVSKFKMHKPKNEFSSATFIKMDRYKRKAEIEFVCDHPFMFLIYYEEFLIYIGRLLYIKQM